MGSTYPYVLPVFNMGSPEGFSSEVVDTSGGWAEFGVMQWQRGFKEVENDSRSRFWFWSYSFDADTADLPLRLYDHTAAQEIGNGVLNDFRIGLTRPTYKDGPIANWPTANSVVSLQYQSSVNRIVSWHYAQVFVERII